MQGRTSTNMKIIRAGEMAQNMEKWQKTEYIFLS